MSPELSPELTSLVKWSVARLGTVLKLELGSTAYHRIEGIRKKMASLRRQDIEPTKKTLLRLLKNLSALPHDERYEIARAFTLMLELMNACENAYRTHRLKQKKMPFRTGTAEKIYYVLTAHPTEARSPANIQVFYQIQTVLIHALKNGLKDAEPELDALLETAWKTLIVRLKKPTVSDEAEHLYSVVLRKENLSMLLDLNLTQLPVLIRSWVGGDKDGHPGVDHVALTQSLQLSRDHLLNYLKDQSLELNQWARLLPRPELKTQTKTFLKQLKNIAVVHDDDGNRMASLKVRFNALRCMIEKEFRSLPKSALRIAQLLNVFPALVIPLELREDSGVLVSAKSIKSLAIFKMLKKIRALAGKQDPCWYARGFIVSMTRSEGHLLLANRIAKIATGGYQIPIVPLFETKKDLVQAPVILESILKDASFRRMIRKSWHNTFEVMLGYSDSAKDAGVFPSRLIISQAMRKLEQVGHRHKVRVVFFQGSGGSIDRGGGPIKDQMAGWGKAAVQTYKATLQGEMVERTFAHPDIFKSQIYKIAEIQWSKNTPSARPESLTAIEDFAGRIEAEYRKTVANDSFIEMIQKVTPYAFLSALKMGSRPTKRAGTLKVSSLRAIPWILCWTQTRVLFPTWWGVGTAWKLSTPKERVLLKKAYREHPTFHSYIHALAFTLAKVELAVWEIYLECSKLSAERKKYFREQFRLEFKATVQLVRELTGKSDLLWYRPWLGKSIELRASMIHPLNLLEILAQRDRDLALLRVSVTGIASGMMTTG